MNNNITGRAPDIIGNAAKTEQLKAELLKNVASLFGDMSLYAGRQPQVSDFAETLNLLIMLSLRFGVAPEVLAREMKMQAKAGLVRNDGKDHGAVLAFVEGDYRRIK